MHVIICSNSAMFVYLLLVAKSSMYAADSHAQVYHRAQDQCVVSCSYHSARKDDTSGKYLICDALVLRHMTSCGDSTVYISAVIYEDLRLRIA